MPVISRMCFMFGPGSCRVKRAHFAMPLRARRAFSARRQIAARPALFGLPPECVETMLGDRRTHARHQVLVVIEIDGAQQNLAHEFVAAHQMAEVSAREITCARTTALLVERPWVVTVAGVLQIDRAKAGEGGSMPAVAGRHH